MTAGRVELQFKGENAHTAVRLLKLGCGVAMIREMLFSTHPLVAPKVRLLLSEAVALVDGVTDAEILTVMEALNETAANEETKATVDAIVQRLRESGR